MYIADNSGQIVKRYQKAHLFQLMDEHLYLAQETATVPLSLTVSSAPG